MYMQEVYETLFQIDGQEPCNSTSSIAWLSFLQIQENYFKHVPFFLYNRTYDYLNVKDAIIIGSYLELE